MEIYRDGDLTSSFKSLLWTGLEIEFEVPSGATPSLSAFKLLALCVLRVQLPGTLARMHQDANVRILPTFANRSSLREIELSVLSTRWEKYRHHSLEGNLR